MTATSSCGTSEGDYLCIASKRTKAKFSPSITTAARDFAVAVTTARSDSMTSKRQSRYWGNIVVATEKSNTCNTHYSLLLVLVYLESATTFMWRII